MDSRIPFLCVLGVVNWVPKLQSLAGVLDSGEHAPRRLGVGVGCAQDALLGSERLAEDRGGLGILALHVEHERQVAGRDEGA